MKHILPEAQEVQIIRHVLMQLQLQNMKEIFVMKIRLEEGKRLDNTEKRKIRELIMLQTMSLSEPYPKVGDLTMSHKGVQSVTIWDL